MEKTEHKNKSLQAAKEKPFITYKGSPISVTSDFSSETVDSRKHLKDVFKVLEENKIFLLRILYLAKLSFRSENNVTSVNLIK